MQRQAQNRRRQMDRALRWSLLLFFGFLAVTQQVLTNGPLVAYDRELNSQPKPQFEGFSGFVLRRLDDLGLRGVTATVLLIAAAFIAYKFKTWRPLNLAVLSLLLLNVTVGGSKILLGRTKPRDGFDLLRAEFICEKWQWPAYRAEELVRPSGGRRRRRRTGRQHPRIGGRPRAADAQLRDARPALPGQRGARRAVGRPPGNGAGRQPLLHRPSGRGRDRGRLTLPYQLPSQPSERPL